MVMASDAKLLSENQLCKLADVARQTRRNWVSEGLFQADGEGEQPERPGGEARYGRLDLLELVASKMLIDALGALEGKAAWRQVRQRFRDCVLSDRIDVVWMEADFEAHLSIYDESLVPVVRCGRLVRVISLTDEMRRAGAAYRRVRAAIEARDAASSKNRRASGNGRRRAG